MAHRKIIIFCKSFFRTFSRCRIQSIQTLCTTKKMPQNVIHPVNTSCKIWKQIYKFYSNLQHIFILLKNLMASNFIWMRHSRCTSLLPFYMLCFFPDSYVRITCNLLNSKWHKKIILLNVKIWLADVGSWIFANIAQYLKK